MKITYCISAFLASLVAFTAQALPGPTSATFDKGALFTVAGYTGASTLSGFPVLVRIAENSPSGFSYDDLQSKSTGADIAFVDMSGNGLPFEIDTWNPSGTSLIWVRLPSMTNGTEFVMCWGSTSSGKTVCPDNPWSGYKGVWHMNAVSPADATGCGNDGTASGDVALATGVVGSGLSYPNQNAFVTCGKNLSNADLAAGYTMEGWVNLANTSGNKAVFGKDAFISLRMEGSSIKITTPGVADYGNVNNFITAGGEWHHVALTFAPNATGGAKIYLDGVGKSAQDTGNIGNTTDSTELWLAHNQWGNGQGFTGILDEYRVYPGVRSAEWLAVSYAAQADAAFLTPGAATPYEATSAPQVGLAVSAVQYTNATFTASVGSLGMDSAMSADASWADLLLVVGADDTLASPLFSIPFDRATAAHSSASTVLRGLVTNTTYYAQLRATNSFDVAGESSVVSFTTLDPGPATGIAAFASRGFTTLSASAAVATFGAGSDSATIRLEASADGFATISATTADVAAEAGSGALLAVQGLAPNSTYALRLRIENEWGLVTYVQVDGTYSTREAPLAATGIGYTFSADGSTLDISFGVTEVYDGASCRATLVYNGRTVGAKNFSTSGLLLWEDIPAAASAAPATVTVVATVDGVDYTKTWTVTVTPGSSAVTVTDVAAHASAATAIRIRPGDVVTLPELFGTASYTVMHDRFLALDGNILTALEPGIAGVKCIDTAGAETTLAVLVLPEVIGNGSIYIYDETASTKEYWTRASSWEKLGSASNDSWPCQPDDIAVIPFYDTTGTQYISHEADFSVGGILFGNYRDVETTCILQRHKDASTSVITFQRTDGELAFAKVTPNTTANRSNTLRFGGYAITLECASSVETDACSNPTDAALNRGFVSYSACTIHLPEGRYWAVDGLPGYNLNMGGTINPPTLSGEGTFWKKGMGGFTFGSQNAFYGTVLDTSHGHFGGFNRAAPVFWHGPGGTNVSVTVAGWVSPHLGNPSTSKSGYGWFRTGWDPGYGSDGPHPDVPWNPRKTMTLRGGAYEAGSTENSSWGVGVRNSRIYEKLVVGAGRSYVIEGDRGNSSGHPINYIEWGALEHQNKGSLVIYDPSRRSVAATASSTNAMTIIKCHNDFLVGRGDDGDCLASDVYPIIPWIVAPTTTDDSSWRNTMFASFDAAGRLTRPIWNNTALDAVASPYSNAYLWDKTIEIGSDVTLNSLFMNNSGKNKWLGEGRTLTITSGGLVMHNNNTAIGQPGRTDNGSLVLGDANHPGYVFAKASNASQPNQIWADVTAPGGFVSSYSGALVLGGNQTGIGGELVVNAGVLTLGTADLSCSLANNLPIRICAGATLAVPRADAVKKNLLQFDGAAAQFGKVEVPEGVAAKCKKAYWRDYPETQEWQNLRRGVYTGDEATALANPKVVYDPEHFSGAGTLEVLRDDLAMPLVIRMK